VARATPTARRGNFAAYAPRYFAASRLEHMARQLSSKLEKRNAKPKKL
jgi:hypothetical protein